ncbi:MAG TPA: acyl-CoA dehydrogenase family protein [Candidatus Limnocylindrales bacterium]|nr:acyl-CoA dehydrogenase family protein [Candidatus Limnocylindrales bacterium]
MRPYAGDDERALAEGVAAFARSLEDRIAPAEAAGTLPLDVVAELGRLGVLGMTIPESDGGLGASSVAFALVLEELAAAWPSLAVGVSVNGGIVAGSLVRLGTPAQRARWLPCLMDGRGLGAFALTEPASGSDAAALRSVARRDGDGWVLSGRKLFVTSARYAPFVIVLARVGAAEPERPHAGITGFIVPTDTPGVVVGKGEHKMGLQASDTSALTFEEVRLPADAVLGEVGKGFGPIAMAGLDAGRIGIAAQSVGIARGALARAERYAAERRQFGRPIADFQAVRFAFARARTEVEAARLLALRAAWLKDRGRPFTREAAEAKLYASEAANRATYAAVQVFGGYGYMREYGVERYARDARATTIYEGTSEVQRMVIARQLLLEQEAA